MKSLVETYKPTKLGQFAGLAKPQAIMSAVAKAPYESAWLFVGPSGCGKTTLALAFCEAIGGELHHIASKACDLETVNRLVEKCWYQPMFGGFHVVLVDECDQISHAAQLAFLSKLDTTAFPPQTVFVFTCNDTKKLEDRFLSRVRTLRFDAPSAAEQAEWLSQIWRKESQAALPNLAAIVEEAGGNLRAALMELELELIVSQQTKRVAMTDGRGFTRYIEVPAFA